MTKISFLKAAILAAILMTGLSGPLARADSDVVECVSRNVWDAGFLLHFDLNSLTSEPGAIDADIYEIITLWTPKLQFAGLLNIVPTDKDEECQLQLTDSLEQPTVILLFHIDGKRETAEITERGSVEVKTYSDLGCDPRLFQKLRAFCGPG